MAKSETTSTGERTVTLTLEELRALTQPAAVAHQEPRSIQADFDAYKAEREQMRAPSGRVWYQACVSDETGARFVAEVSESRPYPAGRCLTLHGYEYPAGSDRSTANGGTCTLGSMHTTQGARTPEYQQWLYEFRKADLRRYAGEPASKLVKLADARATLAEAMADLTDAAASPVTAPVAAPPPIVARADARPAAP